MQEGYRILEHPADIGLEAHGKSLQEVFEYAGRGLMSIIVDPAGIDPIEQRFLTLAASDRENLLVQWLSEILYLYDGQDFLIADVAIEHISPTAIEAIVTGDIVDTRKHQFRMDVKAVTYHQLMVEEREDGCTARVFFDI
ncbi:MAG: archease [Ignavibacteriales bacterium]|nr:archease [Ignavibacteriales bacterium]